MSHRLLAAAIAGAFLLPAAAQAQSRVAIPNVELRASVTGKWVLDPRKCRDIREDVYDARRTTSRRDAREDRRDQRIADCPASAYTFIVDAGQGPKYPVRVGRGRVPREYRGKPIFINGDTIGPDGRPIATPGLSYEPVYQPVAPRPTYVQPFQPRPTYSQPYQPRPTYQPAQPTYSTQQPTYQTTTPTYQTTQPTQPTYQTQQPTYSQPYQPTYQTAPNTQPTYQAPTTAPAKPSSYQIINGVFVFD